MLIGASGWQYDSWRGPLYPPGLAKAHWLEHYARCFQTVEVNSTFYRLPNASTLHSWASKTPEDFVFSVKASRYLTHVRRLLDPGDPVKRLVRALDALGGKLGVVLLQLPPDLEADLEDLDDTLACFPGELRVAVEPRHPSWFTDGLRRLLERRGAALCLADRRSRPVAPLWRTASWGYLRLHEGRGAAHPCYGRMALASWAERLDDLFGAGDEVFAYFNNDARACAVRDARRFAGALANVSLEPTRTAIVTAPGR